MTDTVTISRACLQHVSDALDQCKAEVDEALAAPPSPSGLPKPTVEELQAILDSERTGEKRVFSKPEKVFDNIADAITDADAREATTPSGLRADLIKRLRYADQDLDHGEIAKVKATCWEAHLFLQDTPSSGLWEALAKLRRWTIVPAGSMESATRSVKDGAFVRYTDVAEMLAASPDDGWVQVDEEHPLPDDLRTGDEIRTTKRIVASGIGLRSQSTTHYRRRPSAEQGG